MKGIKGLYGPIWYIFTFSSKSKDYFHFLCEDYTMLIRSTSFQAPQDLFLLVAIHSSIEKYGWMISVILYKKYFVVYLKIPLAISIIKPYPTEISLFRSLVYRQFLSDDSSQFCYIKTLINDISGELHTRIYADQQCNLV